MPTTIYLSVRGDGAWRVLEVFRRALGEDAATLVTHPNRDESGFYGSADVTDVVTAREAFANARQLYPGLKAHLSAPAPERDDAPTRRPAGERPADHSRRSARQQPAQHQGPKPSREHRRHSAERPQRRPPSPPQ